MIRNLIFIVFFASAAFAQDGSAVFQKNCASCHDAGIARVPTTSALKTMFRSTIRQTLEAGPMKMQGAALISGDREAVINFLGMPDNVAVTAPPSAFCKVQKPLSKSATAEWQGWGADASNSRYADAAPLGSPVPTSRSSS